MGDLTMRDYFAIKILQGLLAATGQENDISLVHSAYAYADMMMRVRNG